MKGECIVLPLTLEHGTPRGLTLEHGTLALNRDFVFLPAYFRLQDVFIFIKC